MVKVRYRHLEALKKQLEANNRFLNKLPKSRATTKLIKDNNYQLEMLVVEYYTE